jgi:hypothetical protein
MYERRWDWEADQLAVKYQLIVEERCLHQTMYYKNSNIMQYTIKYPYFWSNTYQTLAIKLNALYRTKAVMYERSNIRNMYQMAMVEYENSVANHYPIRQFEAYVNYTVSYNQNCFLSLYFDQYEYTGGAHGLTVRSSDTWNLQKSKRMELSDFFPMGKDYREYLLQRIINSIHTEFSAGNSMYFEDYEQRVRESFQPNHFYLTEEGIAIYFQQYEIAPYASGIPTFIIPYGPDGVIMPRCDTSAIRFHTKY